jgi:NAD-dependent deacetylase
MTTLSSQTMADIEYAADLFRESERAAVLTGAGISTPSGIPDFRSEGTGLWSRDEPLEVASLSTFRTDPAKFFEWFRPLAGQIYNAQPNEAHVALAQMENTGRVNAVITQNIDMLHQKAGTRNVIEMHGTLQTLSCTQCYRQVEYEDFLPPYIEKGTLPLCPSCGAILKPDVILFGEQLPQKAWLKAQKACRECDLLLVAGSSLEVLPVAGLPMQAIDRGAHLIIINQTPTYLSVRADINIYENVAEVIPLIRDQVMYGQTN